MEDLRVKAKRWLDSIENVAVMSGAEFQDSLVALLEEVADEVHSDAARAEFRRGRATRRRALDEKPPVNYDRRKTWEKRP